MSELQERLNLAITAATQAGHHTLRYFRASDLAIETKPDHSPVTRADKESEQILRAYLAQRFPQDTIVGEEFGTQHGTTDYKWYLDPIDGTKSFIRGIPLFGVMMGLEHTRRSRRRRHRLPCLKRNRLRRQRPRRLVVRQHRSNRPQTSSCHEGIEPLRRLPPNDLHPEFSQDWKIHPVPKTVLGRRLQPWPSRLLRTLPSRHRPRRNHDRPHHERLGQRTPPGHHRRSRRQIHRPQKQPHNPRRQRNLHQRTPPRPSPRDSQQPNIGMNPNAPVVEDATKRAFGAHSAVERRMPY